ncbi:MAG: hypothetical protein AAF958_15470 [Planctomycetota bacterium]
MPKALCIASLAVSAVIILVFLIDALLGMLGMERMAPFYGASMMMDVGFIIFGVILAVLSWTTLREQR